MWFFVTQIPCKLGAACICCRGCKSLSDSDQACGMVTFSDHPGSSGKVDRRNRNERRYTNQEAIRHRQEMSALRQWQRQRERQQT